VNVIRVGRCLFPVGQGGSKSYKYWVRIKYFHQHQQRLSVVNGRKKSKQLSELYRIRKTRFRHAVAAFVRQLVIHLYRQGVSTIVIGELTGIRTNSNHSRQGNAMVHNYWSHKHVADRVGWTAEEYGIKIETVSEAYTSQTCPRCHSRHSLRVLCGFRCLDCGLEAHRDAVGVLNIAARCGGYAVRPMVWPRLLHWDR
jgi:putative transposase